MPTEDAYKDLIAKGKSAVELVEEVRNDLGSEIDGSDEARGHDQWLSGLMLRLDRALEKMRETQ